MSIILSAERKAQIQKLIVTDKRFTQLWNDYLRRVAGYTQTSDLVKPYDETKWWHLIWERIGDAAFVYAITGDEKAGVFVHDSVMHTCLKRKPEEWVGPWFRKVQEPVVGQLETAHISCAVSAAYDMCPGLFSDEEKGIILDLLRTRILPWCKRFTQADGWFNNWKMVLLNGYAAAACVLGDDDAVEYAVEFYNICLKAYNKDSYGESVQYSNYAGLNLIHAYEIMASYNQELAKRMDSSFEADMMKWYAASFMYMKPLNDPAWGDKAYPRTLNFGDSAAIFRPTGDVLMHVAKRYKDTRPDDAGLAMWLFETTYKEDLAPYDRSTFGFFNQYHYYTFINYVSTDEVRPLTPKEAGLSIISKFETGTVAYRDNWDNPKLILGIQGGYEPNNVTAHRHKDQNSFILAYNNERMFVDPGHCCYRLYSQNFSRSEDSHNTWTFEKENGEIIRQTMVSGSFLIGPAEPVNVLERCEKIDDLFVCQSDCAKAYGDDIEKAQRTWLVLGDRHLFIVDRIKSKVPVKPIGHFILNNRGAGLTDDRVFYKKRVVYRRNGVGMKFFPLPVAGFNVEMSLNWGFVHECYHPEANRLGQGKEGSGLIYDFKPTDYTTDYTAVYGIVFDTDKDIGYWHTPDVGENKYFIEARNKVDGFKLSIESDGRLKVTDAYKNKDYYID